MTPLGTHSASLLGAHGSASARGTSPLSSIGGASVLTRERSPLRPVAVGSIASVPRDVRAPYDPGRGQSR